MVVGVIVAALVEVLVVLVEVMEVIDVAVVIVETVVAIVVKDLAGAGGVIATSVGV